MTQQLDSTRLAELIQRKADLLDQILQLVDRQHQIVEAGELSSLMSLLSAKQGLLDRLQVLERELDPFREQDPDKREWVSPSAREACRAVADHATETLQRVMQIEQLCERSLCERRDQVAMRLEGHQSEVNAAASYLNSNPAPARRLDLTSEA